MGSTRGESCWRPLRLSCSGHQSLFANARIASDFSAYLPSLPSLPWPTTGHLPSSVMLSSNVVVRPAVDDPGLMKDDHSRRVWRFRVAPISSGLDKPARAIGPIDCLLTSDWLSQS